MRRLFGVLALVAGVATTAQAQNAWQTEIGIQGGVYKVKPAGTSADDAINFLGLPGGTFFGGVYGSPPVYAIIPWKNKLAVEPQLGLLQVTGTGTTGSATVLATILRLDYAVSPEFYVGGGAAWRWIQSTSQHDGQIGVTVAAGYRLHVSGRVNGRIEANATFRKKDDSSSPLNTYSILAGLSAPIKGGARPTGRAPAMRGMWQPAIGIQGGYLNQHTVGAGGLNVSGFYLPSPGNDLRQAATTIGGPPAIFAIIPIGDKVAFEPAFDVHANKASSGGGAGTVITASGRLNYALSGGWYAAAGASLTSLNYGGNSGTVTGGLLAWGHRFHLTGAFGGRAELIYSMEGKNSDVAVRPVNTFGVLIGATMSLK